MSDSTNENPYRTPLAASDPLPARQRKVTARTSTAVALALGFTSAGITCLGIGLLGGILLDNVGVAEVSALRQGLWIVGQILGLIVAISTAVKLVRRRQQIQR